MNVEFSSGPPGEIMGLTEKLDTGELSKQFPGLRFEKDENEQISCTAVLNVGANGNFHNVKKCEIPVIRLGLESKDGNFSPQISVEDGQEFKTGSFDKSLSKDELIKVIDWLQNNRGQHRSLSSENIVDRASEDFVKNIKDTVGLEISLGEKETRKEYLPYDEQAEVNEDNLKSIDWLVDMYKERTEKPVDQGDERLLSVEVGENPFQLLESGDMYFLLNNTPTIELMDAAIEEGIITEEDKKTYISLQEEIKRTERTKKEYGQDKNYRDGDFWAKADANYEYDAVRQLNYLDIGGEPVMDEFERDYIQLLGANIARYDSAVLEVGFGMGISAGAIQEKLFEVSQLRPDEPSAHIIIEYNKEVAEKAREWAKRQKVPVVILEGDWQEEIKKIPDGILTAALADPYPLSPEEKHEDAARPLKEIYKKLRPGGVASYYPDSQYCLSERHAQLAEEAGFPWIGSLTSRFAQEGKNTGEYYDSALRMAVPVLYKGGGTGSEEVSKVSMGEEEKKELLKRIFVENPKRARDLLTPIFSS